jgi:hypothetical protein
MPHLQRAAAEMVASLIDYYRAAGERFKHLEPLDTVQVGSDAIHDRLLAFVSLLCLRHSIRAVFRKESHDGLCRGWGTRRRNLSPLEHWPFRPQSIAPRPWCWAQLQWQPNLVQRQ